MGKFFLKIDLEENITLKGLIILFLTDHFNLKSE